MTDYYQVGGRPLRGEGTGMNGALRASIRKAAWLKTKRLFAVHGHPLRSGPRRSGTGLASTMYHGRAGMSSPPGKFPARRGQGRTICSADGAQNGSLDGSRTMGERRARKWRLTLFV